LGLGDKIEPESKGNDVSWDVVLMVFGSFLMIFGVLKKSQIDQVFIAQGTKIVATIYSIYSLGICLGVSMSNRVVVSQYMDESHEVLISFDGF
jgi:fructose-1,6-bisphosphatase